MGEVRFAVLCNPIVHLGRNFTEYSTKPEEKHFPIVVPHSTIHTVYISSHDVNSESWKYINHVVEMGELLDHLPHPQTLDDMLFIFEQYGISLRLVCHRDPLGFSGKFARLMLGATFNRLLQHETYHREFVMACRAMMMRGANAIEKRQLVLRLMDSLIETVNIFYRTHQNGV
jgi:hypothetical protein